MGTLAVLSVFFTWKIMAFLLLLFSVFIIIDLFRQRHFLSGGAVYTITMLLAPIAALVAIGTPISPFLSVLVSDENTGLFKAIVILAGSGLLFLTALVIYIRGHISPIDKTSDKYLSQQKLFAVKRLIKVGYAGTAVYGLVTLVILAENLVILYGMYKITEEFRTGDVKDLLIIPLFLIALLVVPCFNIIGIIIVFFIGTEFAALGVTAFMTFLLNLLIANGCIRYILTTDRTKGQKALFIILSFIPAFNIVYGFMCLKKISLELNGSIY